ncbi:MAG: CpaF family protein [Syntrophorhabdales bacterium]|jgi:pilus assembly protein CpaF
MAEFQTTNEYNDLKARVHEKLIDALDLALIDGLDEDALRREIRKVTEAILAKEGSVVPLNRVEKERFCKEVQDEVLGFGPIEPLMRDPTVTDILINSFNKVYIERYGKLHHTAVRFKDESHLRKIIDRIVSAVGRRIDESCPMVDARLGDGSRVNAIIPPLSIDGACVSIRRFSVDPLEIDDLITLKTLTPQIGELLKALVRARQNIVISGGTGTGKTTLLNVLSRFVPENERIVTIEDSAELQLKQAHVVRLETRPANIEDKGEITQRDLVRNSLRMRPDRIIVGEVRGAEVVDMLQAMNTGHDGSLTTIHSNSARDALLRLETLVALAGLNIPNDAVRSYIASAIDIIIQIGRMVDGTRKVVSLQEVVGMEGGVITMQELFRFEQTGIDSKTGAVLGNFKGMGIFPDFIERFRALGITIPYDLFEEEDTVKKMASGVKR